ncbi:MAG TPA: chorismate mutase [Verrucomicrobiae bacterium]|jgi:3-deoxy-7-phosphoheptulonate synthase/chorismate mutase|nr:chorismate mutase [Verrucomicrobiae bacterium]
MKQETNTSGKTLAGWRSEIDAIDTELLRLLGQRANIAREVALIKVATHLPAYDGQRERRVLDQLGARNPGPFPSESVVRIFRSIIRETRRLGTRAMQEQRRKQKSESLTSGKSIKENRNGHQHGK